MTCRFKQFADSKKEMNKALKNRRAATHKTATKIIERKQKYKTY